MSIGPDAIHKGKKRLYIHIHDHLQMQDQNRELPFRPTNPQLVRFQAYQQPPPEVAKRLKIVDFAAAENSSGRGSVLQACTSIEYLLKKKGLQKVMINNQSPTATRRNDRQSVGLSGDGIRLRNIIQSKTAPQTAAPGETPARGERRRLSMNDEKRGEAERLSGDCVSGTWEPNENQTSVKDEDLANQMQAMDSIIDSNGQIKDVYKSEERMSQASVLPMVKQNANMNSNLKFQVQSQPTTQHIHVPMGIMGARVDNNQQMFGQSNNKKFMQQNQSQTNMNNLNVSLSTLQQAHQSQYTSSSLQHSMLANQTYQTNRKRAMAIEAEVKRINKLMNVDMGTFNSNVSRLRVQRMNKEQIETLKVIEEQKQNATMGLAIERGPNKAKLEISMININNQLKESKGLELAQQQDLMRMSVVTKRSYGDVTTLAAQSNAFNLTNMSPKRAFNQSIRTRKNIKAQQHQKSPNTRKKSHQSNETQIDDNDFPPIAEDGEILDTKIQTGMIEISGTAPPGMQNIIDDTINRTKRLQFNVEVGSTVIDDTDKRATNFEKSPQWNHGLRNQVLMFNSLNDFKTDIKKQMMRKLQNATVRNVAGFRTGANQPIDQKTIFSNSFIRDSVISTLKHNSKDGDKLDRADRYSDVSSEMHQSATQTLNQPRLSSLDNRSIDQEQQQQQSKQQQYAPYHMGAKRPSILSQTSYFNQMIMESSAPQQPQNQHSNHQKSPQLRNQSSQLQQQSLNGTAVNNANHRNQRSTIKHKKKTAGIDPNASVPLVSTTQNQNQHPFRHRSKQPSPLNKIRQTGAGGSIQLKNGQQQQQIMLDSSLIIQQPPPDPINATQKRHGNSGNNGSPPRSRQKSKRQQQRHQRHLTTSNKPQHNVNQVNAGSRLSQQGRISPQKPDSIGVEDTEADGRSQYRIQEEGQAPVEEHGHEHPDYRNRNQLHHRHQIRNSHSHRRKHHRLGVSMYVDKDLTLAPLMEEEQADEDIVHYQGVEDYMPDNGRLKEQDLQLNQDQKLRQEDEQKIVDDYKADDIVVIGKDCDQDHKAEVKTDDKQIPAIQLTTNKKKKKASAMLIQQQYEPQNRIEKTFYGRIQLGGGTTTTTPSAKADKQQDGTEQPILVEHQINKPLKGEKIKPLPNHQINRRQRRPPVRPKESEKFDLQLEGQMKDSTATQIDFPDVRIELSELKQSNKGNLVDDYNSEDDEEYKADFHDQNNMPEGIDLNQRNISSGLNSNSKCDLVNASNELTQQQQQLQPHQQQLQPQLEVIGTTAASASKSPFQIQHQQALQQTSSDVFKMATVETQGTKDQASSSPKVAANKPPQLKLPTIKMKKQIDKSVAGTIVQSSQRRLSPPMVSSQTTTARNSSNRVRQAALQHIGGGRQQQQQQQLLLNQDLVNLSFPTQATGVLQTIGGQPRLSDLNKSIQVSSYRRQAAVASPQQNTNTMQQSI